MSLAVTSEPLTEAGSSSDRPGLEPPESPQLDDRKLDVWSSRDELSRSSTMPEPGDKLTASLQPAMMCCHTQEVHVYSYSALH